MPPKQKREKVTAINNMPLKQKKKKVTEIDSIEGKTIKPLKPFPSAWMAGNFNFMSFNL
jgi:hypothetical protein